MRRAEGIGDLISARREAAGLNQTDLARRVGVKQQQVSKWEQGLALPDPVRLPAIADALDIPIADLYAAHATSAQAETAAAKRELSDASRELTDTLRTVERFVAQYQELGHTYQRLDETVAEHTVLLQQILGALEAIRKDRRRNG